MANTLLEHSINPDLALRLVREAKELAFDTETSGLNWKTDAVCGYAFSDGTISVYISTNHVGGGNINNATEFKQELNKAFQARNNVTIGHNIKFDIHFAAKDGVNLNAKISDTMVRQAVIDEHTQRFSLGHLAQVYGVTSKKEQEILDYIALRFSVPAQRDAMGLFHRLAGNDPMTVNYAAGDALTTLELWRAQQKEIDKQELNAVAQLEDNLIWPLVRMERRGIKVDTSTIGDKIDILFDELIDARALLDDPVMKVRSAEELKQYFLLYKITDWPITEAGNPSFNATWLNTTEEGRRIMRVKKLEHFINAFLTPFLTKHVHKGVVYTSFNQLRSDDYGTVSGRLSSTEPNMQQISKRDKFLGELFRSMFIAREGYFLCEADYSQAEPRLYAHYAKEPVLIKGYNSEPFVDMHSIVSQLMGIPRDPDAKIINLGILYSMGKAKLARSLNVSEAQASALLNQWYSLFPRGKYFRNLCTKVAEERGFVRTILGRRRRFPDPSFAYKALNAIIQGGSADILKYKIIQIDNFIQSLSKDTMHMLLNIHDALVFEVAETPEGAKAVREAIAIMEDVRNAPFNLCVPFVAEYKCGKNWGEATYHAKVGVLMGYPNE